MILFHSRKPVLNFTFFIGDEILCVYFKQCIGPLLRGGSWVLRLMSAPAFLGFLPTTNIRHCIHLPPPNTPNCSILCCAPYLCLYTDTVHPPLPNLYSEVVHCTSTISPPLASVQFSNFTATHMQCLNFCPNDAKFYFPSHLATPATLP